MTNVNLALQLEQCHDQIPEYYNEARRTQATRQINKYKSLSYTVEATLTTNPSAYRLESDGSSIVLILQEIEHFMFNLKADNTMWARVTQALD